MTYSVFLLAFLGVPILALGGAALFDQLRGKKLPAELASLPLWAATGLHVAVAVAYTTPWDNYLVASGVWGYNPRLVTGITIGWVPAEEYAFFILQTLLAGLWISFLARRIIIRPEPAGQAGGNRSFALALLGLAWLIALAILAAGWDPGRYLALELAWALPPIFLQAAFGGAILRRHGRLVALSIASLTVYLSAADFLAIRSGTWAINPQKSLPLLLGGVLPLEEMVFFLLTNTLICFGIILLVAVDSRRRMREVVEAISRGRRGRAAM